MKFLSKIIMLIKIKFVLYKFLLFRNKILLQYKFNINFIRHCNWNMIQNVQHISLALGTNVIMKQENIWKNKYED